VTSLRIVYFGTPEFAVPALRTLAMDSGFDVALVVTQGAKGPSPVERAANELGLPTYKPRTLRTPSSREPLIAAAADVFVVAAFGLILGRRTLALPRVGCVNLHPSLLPRYRGASPIMAAIERGDATSGVSLMAMDSGIDSGPVISQSVVVVGDDDTTELLSDRLASVGAAMAVRDIPVWTRGEIVAVPQSDRGATLTRTLTKADGWIDWRLPAANIERHIRAMWPWPRAWTTADDASIQIHAARVVAGAPGGRPGDVLESRKQLIVATGSDEALELLTVEPSGRRVMTAAAYLNGRRSPLTAMGRSGEPPPQPPLVVPVPGAPPAIELPESSCG
jgi:methionyl-tRNA formyltransferase